MQGTLLTIAVAVILALVAALAGPYVVDWNNYRPVVEREAARLTGLDVRVTGAIDAQLLPAPRISLNDITIGGVPARSLTAELSLGALVRGEWRATDVSVVAPQFDVNLDKAGALALPALRPGFDAGAVTIERLHIEDARVALADTAGGAKRTIDKLWFTGDARTLAGPYRGEGAFTFDGALYPYRLTVGRPGDDGKSRVRLNIDPLDRPLSLEADGDVSLTGGVPRFEGTASMARPVQLVAAKVTPPWRATAKVKGSSSSVLLEQIEFLYGQEDQGVRLNGTAEVKFGTQPRLEGVLSARQIDLDRALAGADGTRLTPAAALRTLAEAAAGVLPFPFRLGIGIDSVTLGGGAVSTLRGDIESASDGWRLSGFEFRAPGYSRVQLAGRLTAQGKNVAFNGKADIDASDFRLLAAWLEGRSEVSSSGPARALKAQGDVTLGSETLAVERLKAEFGRETVEGRVSYAFVTPAQPARLDAELRASELDLDAAQSFLQAALTGSVAERPQDIALTVDIARATVAGVPARDLRAKIISNQGGIEIERMAVADLGGAAINAAGRLALLPSPRGSVTADLDARDIAGVAILLARYAPSIAPQLRLLKGASKLHGVLELADATPGTLKLSGNAGAIRVSLNAQASAPIATLDAKAFDGLAGRIEGRLDSDDGSALVNVLGLNKTIAAGSQPGQFTFNARGKLQGELTVDARLNGGGLDLAANGTAQPFVEKPSADLNVAVKSADLRPLLQSAAPVPVTLSGKLAMNKEMLALTDASATLAGSNMRGKMSVAWTQPRRVEGDIAADTINAALIVSAVSGFPSSNTTDLWPIDPFSPGAAAGYQGSVTIKSARASLTPSVIVRNLSAVLTLTGDGATFDDLTCEFGGGRLTGNLSLQRSAPGLRATGRVAVSGADAAALQPGSTRPPITGKFALEATAEGAGLSPSALIGSLKGTGKVTLDDGRFSALDPRVFGAVTQAVDRGLPVDGIRIRDAATKALDAGDMTIKHAEAGLQIADGQARLRDVTAQTDAAAFALNGGFDFSQATVDARLVLSGAPNTAGTRPDIFVALRGPWGAPARSVDVSALVGWLTMRAVDTQAKKLEAIENAPPKTPASAPASEPPRAAPKPVPAKKPAPPRPATAAPAGPLPLTPRN